MNEEVYWLMNYEYGFLIYYTAGIMTHPQVLNWQISAFFNEHVSRRRHLCSCVSVMCEWISLSFRTSIIEPRCIIFFPLHSALLQSHLLLQKNGDHSYRNVDSSSSIFLKLHNSPSLHEVKIPFNHQSNGSRSPKTLSSLASLLKYHFTFMAQDWLKARK